MTLALSKNLLKDCCTEKVTGIWGLWRYGEYRHMWIFTSSHTPLTSSGAPREVGGVARSHHLQLCCRNICHVEGIFWEAGSCGWCLAKWPQHRQPASWAAFAPTESSWEAWLLLLQVWFWLKVAIAGHALTSAANWRYPSVKVQLICLPQVDLSFPGAKNSP